MTFRYAIIGSGKQGTAAAYDLAKFGKATQILMLDANLDAANHAAKRINHLIGQEIASSAQADAADSKQLASFMEGVDVALSAVPYYFNLEITKLCIEKGVSLCDMGGNTDVVWAQLELDEDARAAGVSIIPDCGIGPVLINTMGVYVMDLLDKPREVYLYDAGLPQEPVAPWNYAMTYHINGLTNEYSGDATFIREGKITYVPTFTEREMITFEPLGELEAFVISGSMSTTPQTHLGKLERYENKVLRYPGHMVTFEAYKRLGLFSETAIEVNGQAVIPREVYHTLLAPHINAENVKDIGIMRAIGVGEKDGRTATVTVDLIDRFDEATGFTAMERLTGWHCAVYMGFQARKKIGAGAQRMELAIPAAEVMDALRKRGIQHEVKWE
ncbi:MAG: saccharopine dehydrogenase NADP-binding domain-containing protein [Anaerolineales bacterium]|nr:saccharopine dehydrogenase NADP-binding domain-containing protein [Anaerolineales bacterium]